MSVGLKSSQVYRLLHEKIISGEMEAGCRLPPEKELALQLGVGIKSLRNALSLLEVQHLVVRMRKAGTFVADSPADSVKKLVLSPKHSNVKHKILIAVSDSTSHSSHKIADAADVYLKGKNAESVRIGDSFFESGEPEDRFQWLADQHFTGVILAEHHLSPARHLIPLLTKLRLPVVMPSAEVTDEVITNFFTMPLSPRRAILHGIHALYSMGHRQIGFLGRKRKFSAFPDFFHDVTLDELSLMTNQEQPRIVYAEEAPESIASVIGTLTAAPRPTAILCFNCPMAIALIELLKKKGFDVPGEISVLGYGDTAECEYTDPKTASIHLSLKERAQTAAEFLLNGDYRQEALRCPPIQIRERESIRSVNTGVKS